MLPLTSSLKAAFFFFLFPVNSDSRSSLKQWSSRTAVTITAAAGTGCFGRDPDSESSDREPDSDVRERDPDLRDPYTP